MDMTAKDGGQPSRLWNRNFVLWWLGGAQSAFGTALAGIATSFLVLHQTGSASAMGLNLALAMLPAVLQPFLGAWVDRIALKVPLVLGNVLRGVLQLGIGFWALRGHLPTEAIYAASFLTGLVGAFYAPATQGLVARLVPAGELARATGLMQACPVTSRVKGYPFEVALPEGVGVSGVALADHCRSLDWRSRKVEFIGEAPARVLAEVRGKLGVLLGVLASSAGSVP